MSAQRTIGVDVGGTTIVRPERRPTPVQSTERFDLRAAIDNDANCAALAEWQA